MAHLDFREALSTPDEKLFSPVAAASAIALAAPLDQRPDYFVRGVGFSRSTWTNIVFVAIASVGGLVCAFYFFNGGELLRAAASWPAEFLYPRPISTENIEIAQMPNPIDQFVRSEESSGEADRAKSVSENNDGPSNFSQPATTTGVAGPAGSLPGNTGTPVLPPAPPPIVSFPTIPSLPATPPLPDTPSLPSGFDIPPVPAVDSLLPNDLQLLDQTATSGITKTAPVQAAKNKSTATRRKVAATRKKVSAASATAKNMEQGVSPTQIANQTQTGLSHAPNQTMGGGLGGGLGAGGLGGGLGGGVGAVGGVGGVGGGLGGLGGVNGAGLGGGISGVGLGGLGGLGGKH